MGNKLGLILGVLNTVVVCAVLGLFVYTKLIFKRPAITETKERSKLYAAKPTQKDLGEEKTLIALEPVTANLDPFEENGKQKVHYLSMSMSIEVRSEDDQGLFEESKPVIMDKILSILAKKKFDDLNQVQGRYIFRSQIIDAANEYMGAPVVTEVYFSDFLLQ